MRCPKCHYISFESGDRCRNCGYEFSLATPEAGRPSSPIDELPLHDIDETPQPPIDLSFLDTGHPSAPSEPASFEMPRAPVPQPAPRPAADRDLPLFGRGTSSSVDVAADEDAPLIRPSAVPRAPLAVRRSTPDAQRFRARYTVTETPRLDLGPSAASISERTIAQPAPQDELVNAPPGRRLLAAMIDLLLLGSINVGVLYFTLKLCGLPLAAGSVLELPPVPFFGFLLLIDAGYTITFTAIVGQTIGKMATGLKVINSDEASSASPHPNIGFSILRTAAYAASLLPLGLGFLPALVGRDRRALHDRLAETRVVRA